MSENRSGLAAPGLAALRFQSPFPSHGFSSSLLCLVRTCVIALRSHLVDPECSHLKILNLIMSAAICFPNKVTFPGLADIALGAHPAALVSQLQWPQTGELKQHTFILHRSGGLQVQDQRAGRFGFFRDQYLWLTMAAFSLCLPTVFPPSAHPHFLFLEGPQSG